jgi:hypothetical protein
MNTAHFFDYLLIVEEYAFHICETMVRSRSASESEKTLPSVPGTPQEIDRRLCMRSENLPCLLIKIWAQSHRRKFPGRGGSNGETVITHLHSSCPANRVQHQLKHRIACSTDLCRGEHSRTERRDHTVV